MAQKAGIVDEGVERVQAAFQSVEDEIQKLQKQIQTRSNKLSNAAEKRVKKLRKEILALPAVKRAERARTDITKRWEKQSKQIEKQVEERIDTVLGRLQIASRSDIAKLNKKLSKMNRKLNDLDKAPAKRSRPTPSKPETAVAD